MRLCNRLNWLVLALLPTPGSHLTGWPHQSFLVPHWRVGLQTDVAHGFEAVGCGTGSESNDVLEPASLRILYTRMNCPTPLETLFDSDSIPIHDEAFSSLFSSVGTLKGNTYTSGQPSGLATFRITNCGEKLKKIVICHQSGCHVCQ